MVAISSLGVHTPSRVYAMAAPAKAALEILARHWALALAPRGITVNTVVPGYIQVGMPPVADPRVAARRPPRATARGYPAALIDRTFCATLLPWSVPRAMAR